MRTRALLSCALLASLAVMGAAGSDYPKKKGECLAAALVGFPDVFTPDDAACAVPTSKAACLATTGWFGAGTTLIAASCTWRETALDGSFRDVHTLYRSNSGNHGAIFQAAEFNDFCSLETKISLPRGAKGKYFADTSLSFDTTFAGNSECMAGYRLESSCEAGAMTDPGLALGLPRAFPYIKQLVGEWSLVGDAPFEKSVYVENSFKVNCGRSYGNRRLAGEDNSKGWYRYLNTEQATLGLPASGIFGAYGAWQYVWSSKGCIYEFIVSSAIGGAAKIEVEVLKGSSPGVAVVAYVINLKTFNDHLASCGDTCPAPVHLALASCAPGKKGRCKMSVPSFPPVPVGTNYGVMFSRTTLGAVTDGKSVNLAYKLDLQLDSAVLTGTAATATAIGPATASTGFEPASPAVITVA